MSSHGGVHGWGVHHCWGVHSGVHTSTDLWELGGVLHLVGPGVLLLLNLLKSLLLKLLGGLLGVGIGSGNANEISVEEGNAGGEEKTPNDESLLGLLVVSLIWGTGEDLGVLVAPKDVANVPDGKEATGDNNKLAGYEESGSGVIGVIREECNEESDSNEVWHKEKDSNQDVPPVVGLVKEAVEHLSEDGSEKHDSEDTNGNNTALNWEASETLEVNGLLGGAVADAAAAKASFLFLGKIFEGFGLFWLFLSGTSVHKWGLFHSGTLFHHHIHGFVFH